MNVNLGRNPSSIQEEDLKVSNPVLKRVLFQTRSRLIASSTICSGEEEEAEGQKAKSQHEPTKHGRAGEARAHV